MRKIVVRVRRKVANQDDASILQTLSFFSRLGGRFRRVDEKGKKEKWEISERFYKSVSLKVYWAITAPGRARVRKQYCRRVCCAKTVNRCPKVE